MDIATRTQQRSCCDTALAAETRGLTPPARERCFGAGLRLAPVADSPHLNLYLPLSNGTR